MGDRSAPSPGSPRAPCRSPASGGRAGSRTRVQSCLRPGATCVSRGRPGHRPAGCAGQSVPSRFPATSSRRFCSQARWQARPDYYAAAAYWRAYPLGIAFASWSARFTRWPTAPRHAPGRRFTPVDTVSRPRSPGRGPGAGVQLSRILGRGCPRRRSRALVVATQFPHQALTVSATWSHTPGGSGSRGRPGCWVPPS